MSPQARNLFQVMTLKQSLYFCNKLAEVEQTIQTEVATIHICNIGTKESPCRYVVMNDELGNSTISPPFFNN